MSLRRRRVSNDLECLWHRLVFLKWLTSIVADLSRKSTEFFLGGGTGGCDIDPLINLLNVPPKLDDLTNTGCARMGGDLWWDGYVLPFPLLFGNASKKRRRSRLFEKRLLGAGGRGLFWNMLDTLFVREPRVTDRMPLSNSSGEGDPLIIGFKEPLLPKFWLVNRTAGTAWPFIFLPSKRSPVK